MEMGFDDFSLNLLFFFFLAVPQVMWDLSSPTMDVTHVLCSGSSESSPLEGQGSPWLLTESKTKPRLLNVAQCTTPISLHATPFLFFLYYSFPS